MKICERLEDGISSFYLSEKRFFPNLVELVNFYERNSLSENFTGGVNSTYITKINSFIINCIKLFVMQVRHQIKMAILSNTCYSKV